VWFHGDIASGNLLVRDGRLSAVIDFGTSGVGDPACDLVIAYTFFSGSSRSVFRESVAQDAGTWARARGWALWKALITSDLPVVERVLEDHLTTRKP
jgi:aminoglycoside phosphotransferase (APT) family kinase protein